MTELQMKVQKSIERLKAFEPPEGYYLAFSGGKDSVVCKALLDMAGCKYDAVYRVTSVDPPELVRFIKNQHPDVVREVPLDKEGKPVTMWNIILKHTMPPTRRFRYCCKDLKESGGDGRMTVTGVRWAESPRRKNNQGSVVIYDKKAAKDEGFADSQDFKQNDAGGLILVNDNTDSRRIIEQCYKRHKTNVNPIIEWTDSDVWQFIRGEGIPYCELYDEGMERLGCIGCPLARRYKREREFRRWPKYKHHYLVAFEKMLVQRELKGKKGGWQTGEDVFNWWMEYDVLPGQMNWFDEETEDDE